MSHSAAPDPRRPGQPGIGSPTSLVSQPAPEASRDKAGDTNRDKAGDTSRDKAGDGIRETPRASGGDVSREHRRLGGELVRFLRSETHSFDLMEAALHVALTDVRYIRAQSRSK